MPARQISALRWSGASFRKHGGMIGLRPARAASSDLRLCISREAVDCSHNQFSQGDGPEKHAE
jgi:hypothetical protein